MPDELDEQIATTVARGETYTLLLLWAGPHRDQEESEQDRLQHAHLRHLFGLRNDRPTSNVFGPPSPGPLSDKARADAAELIGVATALVEPGTTQMFADWSIADADLALCLMRMVACQDPMPEHLTRYALAQWERPSIRAFLAHVPTSR